MFLSIKNIPKVKWSSSKASNLKPRFDTLIFLSIGLILFGLGEGLLIVSYTGSSPWSVLAQGISLHTNLSVGLITFFLSLSVLIIWIYLDQKPGIGTILNLIIISVMIDFSIFLIETPDSFFEQILMAFTGVFVVGIGSGFYLIANLGPGPRDGLMVGFQKKTKLPIALVRACIESTVATTGWYLGGTIGFGTLLFAFGVGPCVALGLLTVKKIFKKI